MSHTTPRLAILLSGGGRTMVNLAEAIGRGELDARIALVIASRTCAGCDRARELGVECKVIPGTIAPDVLARELGPRGISWLVLAGYLRMVRIPPGFEGRVVNIHPALLPKFGGPGMHGHHVHEAVIKAGERTSGCTVHLCDAAYDTGPIVLQRSCPVEPGDTPDSLAARVFDEECKAYPEALARLIGGSWKPGDPPIRY
jgi:phosphoribosylglycinamide formyltransferase-1